jgi:hypothetical protein
MWRERCAGALPVIVWEGACRFRPLAVTARGSLTRPGRYSFTDAVALMSTCTEVGGFFIVHLPPDLARMASSLSW